MQKFLSIITINYNNFSGLKKTVDSVVSQTNTNFEYIVIDGDSSDGSCEYLNKKKQLFSYLISEKDSGIYNAMNKGIYAAKGAYLLFLNSGDVLNGTNALEDFIGNSEFIGDIIYGDYKFNNGEKKYPDVLTPLYFFKSSLPHQSSFIKRDLFSKFGLYDERFEIVSDKSFFIKCFLSKKVIFKHINQKLAKIDLNGVSNNPAYSAKVKKENDIILKEHFGIFYQDYKSILDLKLAYKNLEKKTLIGFIIRVKKKVIFIINYKSVEI